MAITKQKKSEIVAKLKQIFAGSPSVAFVEFRKLTVANAQALRRKLRETGSGYFVAKKTLIRKSLEGAPLAGIAPAFPGEIAVAYLASQGDDILAPLREIFGFAQVSEKAVRLVGGVVEGRFIDEAETLALAAIPPRETLLAQFVNVMHSPIQRFAAVLNEAAKKR